MKVSHIPSSMFTKSDVPEYDGLVDREPPGYLVSEPLEDNLSIRYEIINDLLVEPASIGILKVEWHVPVVKRNRRLNTVLDACIDDILIMLQCQLIDSAVTIRLYS